MTKDEALRLALEALERIDLWLKARYHIGLVGTELEAVAAIKAALEAKDEPVAWGVFEGNLHDMFFSQDEAQKMADLKGTHAEVRPLYTTPPQRTRIELTDDERQRIRTSVLKEKNT
jgi:hypothetical protein